MFGIFAGVKVQSGRLNRLKTEINKLIYLFDDNRDCSSFFVGTKNKEQFYNLIFIYFWVKTEFRGFLQSQ
jgi:hypothetical protein